jgi:hypothetical protein
MHLRKCSGYAVYPLLAVLLFGSPGTRAQNTQTQQQTGNPTPGTQQPGGMTPPESESQQSTPQERAQVLREAQQRVNARRKQRVRQIIQDTYSHKYDLYFGAGYLRFRPGSALQHMNEAAWNIGMVDWLHGNWGVAADVRGYYGTAYAGRNPYSVYKPSISQYTFMAGPEYRFFKGQHWGWTGQVLAGAGHGNFGTGTHGLPPQLVGLYTDSTVLNVSAGASVDYNLGPALGLRLTPNVLVTNYGSQWQENMGWTLGVLYRFGRR